MVIFLRAVGPVLPGTVAPKAGVQLPIISTNVRFKGRPSPKPAPSPQQQQPNPDYKRALIQTLVTIVRKSVPAPFSHWKKLKLSGYFYFLLGGFTFRFGVANSEPPKSPAQIMLAILESHKKNYTLSNVSMNDLDGAIRVLGSIKSSEPKPDRATIPKDLADMKDKVGKSLHESWTSIMADSGMPLNNIGVGVVVQFRPFVGPDFVRITLDVDLEF